jgi:hypothetical protein
VSGLESQIVARTQSARRARIGSTLVATGGNTAGEHGDGSQHERHAAERGGPKRFDVPAAA